MSCVVSHGSTVLQPSPTMLPYS